MNARLLDSAKVLGVSRLLRGADALSAATAVMTHAPLISWDGELVDRVGALTPERWMAENDQTTR